MMCLFLIGHPWFTSIMCEENGKKGRFHPYAETKAPVRTGESKKEPVRNHQVVSMNVPLSHWTSIVYIHIPLKKMQRKEDFHPHAETKITSTTGESAKEPEI
jgi:hypothetical protein